MKGNKFIKFNSIVFIIFIILFIIGGYMNSRISFTYINNSILNPVAAENYHLSGFILQIFSAIGVLIQLGFINKKLISK